jgi:hypothetical protein
MNDTVGNLATGTTGVVDTCGKLPPISKTPEDNLPLVANNGNNIRLLTP